MKKIVIGTAALIGLAAINVGLAGGVQNLVCNAGVDNATDGLAQVAVGIRVVIEDVLSRTTENKTAVKQAIRTEIENNIEEPARTPILETCFSSPTETGRVKAKAIARNKLCSATLDATNTAEAVIFLVTNLYKNQLRGGQFGGVTANSDFTLEKVAQGLSS